MFALPPSETLTFLTSLVIALGWSAHCASMCGGFAVAASLPAGVGVVPPALRVVAGKRAIVRQLLYLVGKSLTYVFLGSVAGLFGVYVASSGNGWWRALACVAGVSLIVVGACTLGWAGALLPRLGVEWFGDVGRSLTASLRRLETPLRPLYLGMLSGFLPCPVVYAFLARAAVAESFLEIFTTMLALGLGTAPILVALGLGGRALSPVLGGRLVKASALLMVLLGLWTVYRGFGAAPCCAS